jgi:hypothetical protein
MNGDRPPSARSEQLPLFPPISPWAKFALYLIAQTANGCLMFNAFKPVVVDGKAEPHVGAVVCSIVIFVLGTIVQVVPRKT